MLRSPRTSRKKAAAVFSVSLIHLWSGAAAQNITGQLANVDPLGLAGIVPGESSLDIGQVFGMEDGFKGDFGYGVDLRSTYDSNFFLEENNPDSELVTNLTPWLTYRSDPEGGAPFSFTAGYSPSLLFYLENSDLNDIDQNGNVTVTVGGAKTSISLYLRYDEMTGSDWLTGEFTQGRIFDSGVDGTYQIAPRTLLAGKISASISDYDSSGLVGAQVYRAQGGGLWDATGRLSLGPAVRYTLTQSDNTGDLNAWAFLMNTRYRAGEMTQLSASLGVEHTASESDDSDSFLGFTGALTSVYSVTPKLLWSNSIVYGTVPAANNTNLVVRNLALSTALGRELTRGRLEGGLTLNFSRYQEVGDTTSDPEVEKNLSPYVTYQRRFFAERLMFESQLRYVINRGAVDWSQVQLSVGLQMQF